MGIERRWAFDKPRYFDAFTFAYIHIRFRLSLAGACKYKGRPSPLPQGPAPLLLIPRIRDVRALPISASFILLKEPHFMLFSLRHEIQARSRPSLLSAFVSVANAFVSFWDTDCLSMPFIERHIADAFQRLSPLLDDYRPPLRLMSAQAYDDRAIAVCCIRALLAI